MPDFPNKPFVSIWYMDVYSWTAIYAPIPNLSSGRVFRKVYSSQGGRRAVG